MTALAVEPVPVASTAQRFVVVVFDGVSLGIMSFAFGVFDMAQHDGVLPDLEVRVVSGEPPSREAERELMSRYGMEPA